MQKNPKLASALFVVATPIGNLKDITLRALEVLREVDFILVEDTRHSQKLLSHYQIATPLHALHEYNEQSKARWILNQIQKGKRVALISDAGTPLINDPGFYLVRLLREEGIAVIPIPGPCAFVTALSVSGLPTDRWAFEGFLPAKKQKRCVKLKALLGEARTLVFYESCHRILESLSDMNEIFGGERLCVLARELTKNYESVLQGSLSFIQESVSSHAESQKGEFVILLGGAPENSRELSLEAKETCALLLEALPLKQAVGLAAKITKLPKNRLYNFAINEAALKKEFAAKA